MKFEKHLKNVGICGTVFAASNGEKYLRIGRYGSVLVRIPAGFSPITATSVQDMEPWVNDLLIDGAEDLQHAELFAAKLEKDGRAKDILRVWRGIGASGEFDEATCTIDNAAFGLIERGDDVRIFDPRADVPVDELEPLDEQPTPEETVTLLPALVILNRDETVEGIIFESGDAI